MSGPTITIDARGMRCPWPALRLAKAMRDSPPATIIRLIADDPNAAGEIAALATAHGWSVVKGEDDSFDVTA